MPIQMLKQTNAPAMEELCLTSLDLHKAVFREISTETQCGVQSIFPAFNTEDLASIGPLSTDHFLPLASELRKSIIH